MGDSEKSEIQKHPEPQSNIAGGLQDMSYHQQLGCQEQPVRNVSEHWLWSNNCAKHLSEICHSNFRGIL